MIILFGGGGHVGKSTCCKIAKKLLVSNAIGRGWSEDGAGIEIRSFAQRVYEVAGALTGVVDWSNKTDYCPSPFERYTKRQVLEMVGEDLKNTFGKDVWARTIEVDYSRITLVDDLRFKEESDRFPRSPRVKVVGPKRVQTHDMAYLHHLNEWEEKKLTADFNFSIKNEGDEEALTEEIDKLLRVIGVYEYNVWQEPYDITWMPL